MTVDADGLLRAALDASSEPWLLWAADGRVVASSQRLEKLLGLSGQNLVGVSEPALVGLLAKAGARLVSDGQGPSLRTAAGAGYQRQRRPLPGGAVLDTFHDEAAERQSAARREELLGVAIHDLRAPLANVRSYASLLLSGKMPELDPRVRRSAEVIARNADRALRLLQLYFDAHRAETGELDIDRQPIAMEGLIQEVIAARRPTAAERGVTLETALPATLPTLEADRERLSTAFGALLDNALARTPSNTQIKVVVEERPREMWLGVVDTGPLLTEEELRIAFDRDAQALKERRLGVGFACAVAGAIARTHGGDAGVRSAANSTLYWLSLPLA
ncbi:MAG: PAS domain-containing sensor histidine kinase [Deltaproteobacteria bacterium]|nr:PAS domain-containing sensor histidine kinase [Deltaproteobacteria bacterium]